jgi:diacylglycerol kinase (ATP)
MSRRGVRRRGRAVEAFRKAGVTVTELLTSHPGHAREVIAARREVWDAVFVLGGDGTVMEVVGALARSGIPVGVLPGGTGNLVAGVLGVPGNISKAVAALLNGGRGVLDLGQLPDERYFAFAAGVGIDVAMVERTTHSEKRFLGMLSYALTAARAAFGRQAIDLTATVDGVVVQERVILAMVANAGSIFRDRFSVGPEVKPDDGELDLCLFAPVTTGDVFSLLWRILRKDFRPHQRMRFIRGKQFELSTEPPVTVQADGDLVGRTPIRLNVVPGAATFLLPAVR